MTYDLEYFPKIEQGTEEWARIRSGLCTASEAKKELMAGPKGFETYILKKEAERHLINFDEEFKSYWTERGKELEPHSRFHFMEKQLVTIEEVGFIRNKALNAGLSPDGIIKKGVTGWETKCYGKVNHWKAVREGVDEMAYSQVQFSMAVSGYKEWWVSYFNPDFEEKYKQVNYLVPRSDSVCLAMQGLLLDVKRRLDELAEQEI